MPTLIVAGDSSNGANITSANDNALTIQTGPNGAKVNAVAFASDGTPTLIKGPTIGSAPTPVPSGSAPLYGCRAWCVFNGTTAGTNAPTNGGNVTTVTRNSTGNYTANFTTAMPDANFAVVGTTVSALGSITLVSSTTTSVTFTTNSSSFTATDYATVSVAIFR